MTRSGQWAIALGTVLLSIGLGSLFWRRGVLIRNATGTTAQVYLSLGPHSSATVVPPGERRVMSLEGLVRVDGALRIDVGGSTVARCGYESPGAPARDYVIWLHEDERGWRVACEPLPRIM